MAWIEKEGSGIRWNLAMRYYAFDKYYYRKH
jgi:hypothetical protein